MKLKVIIHHQSDDDIALALKEVARKVQEGYTSGFDQNDTGRYSFVVTEPDDEPSPEPPTKVKPSADHGKQILLAEAQDHLGAAHSRLNHLAELENDSLLRESVFQQLRKLEKLQAQLERRTPRGP